MTRSLKASLALICLLCLLVSITMPAAAIDPEPVSNTPPDITQSINDSGDDNIPSGTTQPADNGDSDRALSIKTPPTPTSKVTPPPSTNRPTSAII